MNCSFWMEVTLVIYNEDLQKGLETQFEKE